MTVSVRIPTNSLKRLLEEQPDLLLQVENMACEKIAEELVRKVIHRGETDFTQLLSDQVTKQLQKTDHWGFTRDVLSQKAQGLIDEAVKIAVNAAVTEQKNKLVETIQTHAEGAVLARAIKKFDAWQTEIRAYLDERDASIKAEIKELARSEFLSVLQEVKAATG